MVDNEIPEIFLTYIYWQTISLSKSMTSINQVPAIHCNFHLYFESLLCKTVLGHFGHRHFGHGGFCLDISASDILTTENAEGGHFGHKHKFLGLGCVMHFLIF